MNLEQQLIKRLQTLAPIHLEVINESAGHGDISQARNPTLR